MQGTVDTVCTAFVGAKRIAAGRLGEVALAAKAALDADPAAALLIFDDENSAPVEVDFRGSAAAVVARLAPGASPSEVPAPRGPGRPKLGVVAREVTLLPRHWEWLSRQPGGASVAMRKLVEEARRASAGKDRARQAQEAAYRFMVAMAGNAQGFEDAARALFANDAAGFMQATAPWPEDVRAHAQMLAARAFPAVEG